ncbi:MAG TPA: hypothetical protein VFK52_07135 [Nocardioidaceae bacterium]|nr:hypothetical protein [Nocardioidaceae bacterium]
MSRTTTSAEYRLYALAGGPPDRPGLVHVGPGGRAIDVEVYRLPRAAVGDFLARVAPPLALGTVTLAGGAEVTGFVCEPRGVAGARDISDFGGWRAYVRTLE